MIWGCPRCVGPLTDEADVIVCSSCGARYPVVCGIPDFRLPELAQKDMDADRSRGRRFDERLRAFGLQAVLREIFDRPEWTEEQVAQRIQRTLEAPRKLREELDGWLRPCADAPGPFLDVGCGLGGLICAAADSGRTAIGVDASIGLLVVAKSIIESRGERAVLAAAFSEALPLSDGSVSAVVFYDVIEHVYDVPATLREANRVTGRRGHVALASPNRYSFAAEPHVGMWGVGWLPQRWQARYVFWRSGQSYDHTRLISTWNLARLFRDHTAFDVRFQLPPISSDDIQRFSQRRALLARVYNSLTRAPVLRRVFLGFGPLYHVTGSKPA